MRSLFDDDCFATFASKSDEIGRLRAARTSRRRPRIWKDSDGESDSRPLPQPRLRGVDRGDGEGGAEVGIEREVPADDA